MNRDEAMEQLYNLNKDRQLESAGWVITRCPNCEGQGHVYRDCELSGKYTEPCLKCKGGGKIYTPPLQKGLPQMKKPPGREIHDDPKHPKGTGFIVPGKHNSYLEERFTRGKLHKMKCMSFRPR